MSITTINSTDSGSASLTKINDNFTDLNTTKADGTGTANGTNTGDASGHDSLVVGPASATDNAIARFDSTTGKLLQNSGIIVDDLDTTTYRVHPSHATTGVGNRAVYGGANSADDVGGIGQLQGGTALSGNKAGGAGVTYGGSGSGSGTGGAGGLYGGTGGATGAGGAAIVQGGAGGATSGDGGSVTIQSGSSTSGNAGYVAIIGTNASGGNGNGGNVYLIPGAKNGSGANGKIQIRDAVNSSLHAVLDTSSIASSDKTFTFPNETGTIAVGTPWTTWNPTFANFTKGSATITARYTMIGKTVFYTLRVIIAADSSMGTNPTFTLPVTSVSSYGSTVFPIGQINIIDAGTGYFYGNATWESTTTAALRVLNTGATYATTNNFTATVPFTWTTNDAFEVNGTYEAA